MRHPVRTDMAASSGLIPAAFDCDWLGKEGWGSCPLPGSGDSAKGSPLETRASLDVRPVAGCGPGPVLRGGVRAVDCRQVGDQQPAQRARLVIGEAGEQPLLPLGRRGEKVRVQVLAPCAQRRLAVASPGLQPHQAAPCQDREAAAHRGLVEPGARAEPRGGAARADGDLRHDPPVRGPQPERSPALARRRGGQLVGQQRQEGGDVAPQIKHLLSCRTRLHPRRAPLGGRFVAPAMVRSSAAPVRRHRCRADRLRAHSGTRRRPVDRGSPRARTRGRFLRRMGRGRAFPWPGSAKGCA